MDDDERIRERAYHLWLDEGQPDGRAETHWDKARELVAIEESQRSTTFAPNGDRDPTSPTGEPIEEPLAVTNQGEFPTLTDEGEEVSPPAFGNEGVEKGPL